MVPQERPQEPRTVAEAQDTPPSTERSTFRSTALRGASSAAIQLSASPLFATRNEVHSVELTAEPVAVGRTVAAKLHGLSPRTWSSLDARGLIPRGLRIGRRRLWLLAELRRWAAAGCPSREQWESNRGEQS